MHRHSRIPFLTKSILALAFACLLGGISASPAQAQRASGAIGIGGQIGEPSGISLIVYQPRSMSYEFLAAWESDDFFFLNAHGLFDQHVGRRQNVHFFYGPGVFLGLRDRGNDEDDETVAGISGRVGLGFLINQFEIYGQLTPRLSLTPNTNGDIGGGLGFRYYF
jgi:hypothetical protein